ncbi:MAG: hypothetical protein ACJA1Y_000381 [Burkholderiaceae bacterium]|jgi:hypothetical protein
MGVPHLHLCCRAGTINAAVLVEVGSAKRYSLIGHGAVVVVRRK